MPRPLKMLLGSITFGAVMFGSVAGAAPLPESLRPPTGGVTYVDFWASWCTPCAAAFPWLNEMQARYGQQGLRVVGVGVDAQPEKGDRFLKAHPAQFTTTRDPEGKLAEQYGVEGMPYAVLLDAQGRVLHRHTGFHPDDAATYERAIQQALNDQGAGK